SSETMSAAQQGVRRTAEHHADVERRLHRAERELHDANALAERLSARHDDLAERRRSLETEVETITAVLASTEAEIVAARSRLGATERAQDEARELRTKWQVEEAQAEARLQVASDRERRLAEEYQSASARLGALRAELSDLSQADGVLAEQVARWHLDLETREATLAD